LKLKILKKLRTASLKSEFTGSYKKKCNATVTEQLKSSRPAHHFIYYLFPNWRPNQPATDRHA